MKKNLAFFFCILSIGSVFAQDSTIHPYVGGSMNGFGWTGGNFTISVGFGIEAGFKYDILYAGFEYGLSGIVAYREYNTADPIPGTITIPPDFLEGNEIYYGFHMGIIYKKDYWFGLVFLWSSGTVFQQSSNSDVNKTWFNVGPDIRFTISEHYNLNFAYTTHRGLKAGLAYLF